MDRATLSHERRMRPLGVQTRFHCYVFRDEAGRRGITRRDDSGRMIRPARAATLLAYMADARAHKRLHDFLTYRERLRALRQGRAERELPLKIKLEDLA